MNNNLYIVWNERNNTGISIIDEQHRGIIATINSLYYFIQGGHGEQIIQPTMIMLMQYTAVHFQTEEAILEDAAYPDLKNHSVLHKTLLERTRKLSIDTSRNKDPRTVLRFLKEWWLGHIGTEDMKYVPYVTALLDTRTL